MTGQEAWKDGFSAIQLRKVGNNVTEVFLLITVLLKVHLLSSKLKSQKEAKNQQDHARLPV
jgi:hypothetical protein